MLRLLRLLSTRRPRGRAVLAVAGIALGVALAYGVHLVNGAAIADLAASVRELSGEADIEVRAAGGGFPESLYPAIARLPGVAWARPGLELDAALADGKGAIRVAGIDAVREGRPALLKADSVLLAPAPAGRARDGKLRLLVGQHPVELEVAGTVEMKGAIALTDVSTAQWRLGRLGELNRIDVRIARGADREGVLRSVAAALPPGVHASFVEALEEAGR